MKLHFARHGQSMGNMAGDYSTDAHDRLSPAGKKQALRLAARLAALMPLFAIWSPLKSAAQDKRE